MKNTKQLTKCPRCQGRTIVKNGSVRGVPKWRCKSCRYQFSTDVLPGKPNELKRLALHMYLEGLGFRSIERILGVSNVAVMKWVRQAAEQIRELHKDQAQKKAVSTMELDEMWHYIGKKNKNTGSGLLMIEKGEDLWPGRPVIGITLPEGSSGKK